jgi:hypothetical protein
VMASCQVVAHTGSSFGKFGVLAISSCAAKEAGMSVEAPASAALQTNFRRLRFTMGMGSTGMRFGRGNGQDA